MAVVHRRPYLIHDDSSTELDLGDDCLKCKTPLPPILPPVFNRLRPLRIIHCNGCDEEYVVKP